MDLLFGIVTDLAIIAGIVVVAISFRRRHAERQTKLIVAGAVMIVTGLLFTDWAAVSDSFDDGYDAGKQATSVED